MAKAQTAQSKAPEPAQIRKWSHGHFYWNELMAHDAKRARKFYETTLGWRFDSMPMGEKGEQTYWVAKLGNETIGGISEMKGPDFKDLSEHWLPYIAVDDVDRRVAKAVAEGAKICRPAFEVPGAGRIALLSEPGGAMVGWMTPEK